MIVYVVKDMLGNMSIIIFIAYFLSKLTIFKNLVTGEKNSLGNKLVLAVIFGLIGILATYTGTKVNGAIANSRIIGVFVGGLYGGPIVGIGAGLIAGFHRWSVDIGGFTAVACALSTVAEGAIGGLAAKHFKKYPHNWAHAFILGMLAEVLQMLIILAVARPFREAVNLVRIIWVPMVLINPIGISLFVGFIGGIYNEREKEAALQTKLALDIAERCLGYLRKGLGDVAGMEQVARIILEMSGVSAVAITNRRQILAHVGIGADHHRPGMEIQTALTRKVIETGKMAIVNSKAEIGCTDCSCQLKAAVIFPLFKRDEVIGSIKMYLTRENGISNLHITLGRGLAKLFSTQLELADIEYQKKLCQKAELKALQSQINPHFLFNSLNTISAFCRTKPQRARELLIDLSTYFRNTLQQNDGFIRLSDELKHLNAYLELERARFEERLQVIFDIPEELDCILPQFILQPLVENAVKHGVLPAGGTVTVRARKATGETIITIENSGVGMAEELIQKLYSDNLPKECIGLSNVHKRLKSIYGETYGLTISAGPNQGTSVRLRIPDTTEGDFADADNIDCR